MGLGSLGLVVSIGLRVMMEYGMHLSVSQLADYVNELIEIDPHLGDLWVEGEVSKPYFHAAGHVFFNLIDGNEAVIRAVLFRTYPGSDLLTHGVSVNAHGRISFYKVRGDLQLYVDSVQPAGLGLVALEAERLRARLEAEGLFELSRKRRLPDYPRRVGVVTSEQGAVFHDIANIISRRYPIAEIVLCPTPVQGIQAAEEIALAIRTLDSFGDVDLIIVARGGGSLEDLAAFNSEIVARAIFGSRSPIVSAVGHETDTTIADEVADYRAPTPSAAAEAVTPDSEALIQSIDSFGWRASLSLKRRMSHYVDWEANLELRLQRQLPDLNILRDALGGVIHELSREVGGVVRNHREVFLSIERNLGLVLTGLTGDISTKMQVLEAELKALNPTSVLKRGYSVLTQGAEKRPISSITQIRPDITVDATLSDGQLEVQVFPRNNLNRGSSDRI